MSRFIDDVSVLAIEDRLISKLSTLFRSSKISEMGIEDIYRLAGETMESSLERQRLEAKRRILEAGLQGLRSLHKRKNVARPPTQDQDAANGSEEFSDVTPGRSEGASTATSSVREAPQTDISSEPFHEVTPGEPEWGL